MSSRGDIRQHRKRPCLTQREHSDGKNVSIYECAQPAKVFPTKHGVQQAQSKELPCSVNSYAEFCSSVYGFQQPELERYPPIAQFELGYPLGGDRIVPQGQSYDGDPKRQVPSGSSFVAPYSNLPMGNVPIATPTTTALSSNHPSEASYQQGPRVPTHMTPSECQKPQASVRPTPPHLSTAPFRSSPFDFGDNVSILQ